MIEALRKRIEELTDQLLAKVLQKQKFDLIGEYALPLGAN
jgi:cytochrome P450